VLRIFESFGVTKDRLCVGRAQSNLFRFEGAAQMAQTQKSLFDFYQLRASLLGPSCQAS